MANALHPAPCQPHPAPHPPQPRIVYPPVPAAPRAVAGERPIPDTLCDAARHVLAWQAHIDAGRIGHRIPVSPEIAANRDRWTALARTMRR
ncbi:hypothetical protein [Sphingomonas sp. M1A8_2b]